MFKKTLVALCIAVIAGAPLAYADEDAVDSQLGVKSSEPQTETGAGSEAVVSDETAGKASISDASAPATTLPSEVPAFGSCPAPTCNSTFDCFRQSYSCPLGEFKTCWNGTGSGCQGTCGCN